MDISGSIIKISMRLRNKEDYKLSLGNNIQYLRKQRKMTQEELAEHMSVSRQTISKWESDDAIPEMNKLIDICNFFSCKLDPLIREDMTIGGSIYSPITIQTVKSFKMARYVMITPNPEDDVNAYMDMWAKQSGLLQYERNAKRIGWDFPFVSMEQQNRFGLRGYVAAYILPDGFETTYPGVEFAEQKEANYAVITIEEPFEQAFERIPNAYKMIMEYLQANGFKEKPEDNVLSCFEYVYEKDGVTYMDVFIHVDSVAKANIYNQFA